MDPVPANQILLLKVLLLRGQQTHAHLKVNKGVYNRDEPKLVSGIWVNTVIYSYWYEQIKKISFKVLILKTLL